MSEQTLLYNRYEIKEVLGHGGFATTYLAVDTETQQKCAIKCLSFRKIKEWKTWELFEREAKILKALNHPQIPKYLDFFTLETEQDVEMYLVQEYVEGQNLAQLAQAGRHFTEAEVIRMALKICRILEYLHSFSPPLIHRDIKPSNITLDANQRAYLIDFGAVKDTIVSEYSKSGGVPTVVGTYGYMAIEQSEGHALPASDIYALGRTLIYLLSHKEPAEMEKKGLALDFRPYVNISDRFAKVLDKMIAPDWTKRYQTAAELRTDLEKLRTQKVPVRGVSRNKILLAAIVLIVFLIGFGSYFALRFYTPTPPPLQPEVETELPPAILATATPSPAPQSTLPEQIPVATRMPTILITPSPVPTPVPTQTPVATSTPEPLLLPSIQGRLLFDGRPITNFTNIAPTFWFRNEDTNQEQSALVRYENGSFFVYDLPSTGNFGVSVNIDANMQNPWSYPGDFRVWQPFSVIEGTNPELILNLEKILHLTSPQDNGTIMAGWDSECMEKVTLTSPVTFRWESLSEGVYYDYEVYRMDCRNNYNSAGTMKGETITATEATVNLPPSRDNECYAFDLSAHKAGRRVGMLITHGAGGYGWDYRFRVK